MKIAVKTEDGDGNVTFDGFLNKQELNLVLNVGINFLMARGAMPLFTGLEEEDEILISPTTPRPQ